MGHEDICRGCYEKKISQKRWFGTVLSFFFSSFFVRFFVEFVKDFFKYFSLQPKILLKGKNQSEIRSRKNQKEHMYNAQNVT